MDHNNQLNLADCEKLLIHNVACIIHTTYLKILVYHLNLVMMTAYL